MSFAAMTRTDATKEFDTSYKGSRTDLPELRQAWVNFIDALHREGRITKRQVETWRGYNTTTKR